MFDVWLLHLVMNSVPGTTETGRNPPFPLRTPTAYWFLPVSLVAPASEPPPQTSSKQKGGVRKRTVDNSRHLGAVHCYLGNSQSAIRAVTNGKRR